MVWMYRAAAALVVVLVIGHSHGAPLAGTGPDSVPFVAYAQVDRPDGSYRRMLTSPDVVSAATAGEPLPDGTRIMMETYYRPGEVAIVFHAHKVDGRWQYGSFRGGQPENWTTRPQASCLSCHAGAAATDFTFTKPSLDAAAVVGLTQFTCDRGGRSPCASAVYEDGARP